MNKLNLDDSELVSKFQQYISSGKLDHTGLDSDIADSWERSYAAAVDRHEAMSLQSTPPGADCRYSELVDVIVPIMNDIYKSLKGAGFQVLLTNENGALITCLPKQSYLSYKQWSEDLLGTNAIGTAIIVKKAIQIVGSEHFRNELHSLTSSAVPVFDANGTLTAILALIGPKDEDHSHVLTMLQKAVIITVNKWRIAQKNRQIVVYSDRLRNIFNIMFDGVIIVTANGVIEDVNPAASRILGKETSSLNGIPFETMCEGKTFLNQMLNTGVPFSDVELFLDSSAGRVHCLASGQTSRDEKGNITGGIIVMRGFDKVHQLVNSVCGARAELNFQDIIGRSQAIMSTINIARGAANSMSNVLIQGDSGTGKEIFARAIHNGSERRKGPFIAINCGAIPRELIGSELFGYVDGAFTGARRGGRLGKFEMAAGGTLFLDEIGDMPLDEQVVLLRVLQDRLVTRIGDSKEIPVDVRILCATNKDLMHEVQKGSFRQDLYYRLNVISLTIPPLRDRKTDISLLVNYCLEQMEKQDKTKQNLMNPAVMSYLSNYTWPGNVRELQNVVERMVIIAEDRLVNVADLPLEIRMMKDHVSNKDQQISNCLDFQESYAHKRTQLIAEQESTQIKSLLRKHRGNHSEVAKAMGFSRTTLYRKLKQYNISRESW